MKTRLKVWKKHCVIGLFAGLFSIGFFSQTTAEEMDYSNLPGMPKLEIMSGNDRWGCEVLLCLANPNGPRAVSECKPPIDKLFKCLAKPHPCSFPQCPMAGEGNYAKQLTDSYDPCSLKGMEDAPVGYIAQGTKTGIDSRGRPQIKASRSSYNYGGEHWFSDGEGGSQLGGSKACVRNPIGTVTESYQCSDGESTTTCYRTVKVYEEVLWQKQQSRRAIDVFIEGKNWTRVHW